MTESDSARLARIIADLGNQPGTFEVMQYVVMAACEHVPGAQHAGITLLRRGKLTTPAATSDLIRQIEAIEFHTGQGPCVSAALEQPLVHTSDLAQDTRWPEFSARVLSLGIRSMLSLHFAAQGRVVGALNLYAAETDAFGPEAEQSATILAPLGAVVLALVARTENLESAVATRDVIGQAKGILMERCKFTADQAFELLTASSQATNSKLHDVAAELADTGHLKGFS